MACGIRATVKPLAQIQSELKALASLRGQVSSLANIEAIIGCIPHEEGLLSFYDATDVYLHPDGDDAGSATKGLTAGTAITQKRFMELTGIAAIVNPLTVHVTGKMSSLDPYMGPHSFLPGATMTWEGEDPTQLFTGVIAGGVDAPVAEDPASQTRARFKITGAGWETAGPGGTSLIGKMARVTDSPNTGGANVGAVFKLQAIGGDADTAYHNRPIIPSDEYGSFKNLADGDTIVVEDLTDIGPVSSHAMSTDNPPDTGAEYLNPQLRFRKIRTPSENNRYARFLPQTSFQGCEVRTEWLHLRGIITGSSVDVLYLFPQEFCYLAASSLEVDWFYTATGEFSVTGNCSFTKATNAFPNATLRFSGSTGFFDWSGAAATISNDSSLDIQGLLWGTSAVAGSYGLLVNSTCRARYTQVPTINGAAAHDFRLGSDTHVWNDITAGAGLINANGAALVPY